MKLVDKTPEEVVMFLAGSLPAAAYIHMRQLGLFVMITQLPDNILNTLATRSLSTESNISKSWFIQIRKLSVIYDLPSPLAVLSTPLSKLTYKGLIKGRLQLKKTGYLMTSSKKVGGGWVKFIISNSL